MIPNFLNFLDEASLKDNPGIPGEAGNKGKKYLSDTERASLRHAIAVDDSEFFFHVERVKKLQENHKPALEKLAEKTIRSLYGTVIKGVNLVCKFPKQGQLKEMMDDVQECCKKELEELKDKKVISEIHRRKILNNITQGEAINSKKCLNLPEVLHEMETIMGKENAEQYIESLNRIADIAQSFYWKFPVEFQKKMWNERTGFAGVVKCEWKPKEKGEEDLAQKILDDIQKDGKLPEETEKVFDEFEPTITAVGTDFGMLIHEAVKGVYELIASIAIPKEESMAKTVIMNTDSLADEIEDIRYGPTIAADLRDLINSFPEVDKQENLRELVLIKIAALDAKEFLDFMVLVLNGDEQAKPVIQKLIDKVVEEEKEGYEEPKAEEPQKDFDPSILTKKEIQALIDKALDDKDYKEVERLSKYLGESEKIELYEKLQLLLKNKSE